MQTTNIATIKNESNVSDCKVEKILDFDILCTFKFNVFCKDQNVHFISNLKETSAPVIHDSVRLAIILDSYKMLSFLFQRARLSEVKRQEQELLENQSIPLRNYLMKHVMPTLTQGLIQACKARPDDPIDFLVSFAQPFHQFPTTFPMCANFLITKEV